MGRPREFDMDQVLESAINAFWNQGYEATSLSDLMDCMNLQKGSIYKAFGDKHSLFISSLERYLDDVYKFNEEAINCGRTPKDALKQWLDTVFKNVCGQSIKRGCMVVNSLVERVYQDEDTALLVKGYFVRLQKLLVTKIEEGQALNQFRKDCDAKDISQIIIVSYTGMLAMSKGVMTKNTCLNTTKNILKLIEA